MSLYIADNTDLLLFSDPLLCTFFVCERLKVASLEPLHNTSKLCLMCYSLEPVLITYIYNRVIQIFFKHHEFGKTLMQNLY